MCNHAVRGSARHPQLIKRNQKEFTDKIQSVMKEAGIDTMLLMRPENILYATGYKSLMPYAPGFPLGSCIVIVPSEGDLKMVINSLEIDAALSMTEESVEVITYPSWCVIDDGENSLQELPEKLDPLAPMKIAMAHVEGAIGMELSNLSVGLYKFISTVMDTEKIKDINALMLQCRTVKTEWEIDMLRYAAQHTHNVVEAVMPMITEGMPAYEMENLLVEYGAKLDTRKTMTTYNFICTYGPYNYNCGLPRGYTLQKGDIVKFDGGFEHFGYKSDIARTFVIGDDPGELEKKVFETLYKANELGVSMIKPGVKLSEIYQVIRQSVEADGVIPYYPRGHMGHSIGVSTILEEYPQISKNAETVLEPGMVLCVETPFASAGRDNTYFGMNIEDTLVVTEDGYEKFTVMPNSLVVKK